MQAEKLKTKKSFLGYLPKSEYFWLVFTLVIHALFLNWLAALVLTLSMYFHEKGHGWGMNHTKIGVKYLIMLPFIGALIGSKIDYPKRRGDLALIALMGPCAGFILATVAFFAYAITNLYVFTLAAFIGAVVNLFNLLPLPGADGGRFLKEVCVSTDRRFWWVVMVAGIAATFYLYFLTGLWPILVVLFFFFLGIRSEMKPSKEPNLVPMTGAEIMTMLIAYIAGIVIFIYILMNSIWHLDYFGLFQGLIHF